MYTITSTTAEEDKIPLNYYTQQFQIENGKKEELVIINPFLDNDTIAEERAKSAFLENSYFKREVHFKTPLTNISSNDDFTIRGVPYLAQTIITKIDLVKIVVGVTGVRYEL